MPAEVIQLRAVLHMSLSQGAVRLKGLVQLVLRQLLQHAAALSKILLHLAALGMHAPWLHRMLLPRLVYRVAVFLTSTQPGRILLATAASMLCLQLRCSTGGRPGAGGSGSGSSVQGQGAQGGVLSATVSLLFGLVKYGIHLELQIAAPTLRLPWRPSWSRDAKGQVCSPEDAHAGSLLLQPGSCEREEVRFICSQDFEQQVLQFLSAKAAATPAVAIAPASPSICVLGECCSPVGECGSPAGCSTSSFEPSSLHEEYAASACSTSSSTCPSHSWQDSPTKLWPVTSNFERLAACLSLRRGPTRQELATSRTQQQDLVLLTVNEGGSAQWTSLADAAALSSSIKQSDQQVPRIVCRLGCCSSVGSTAGLITLSIQDSAAAISMQLVSANAATLTAWAASNLSAVSQSIQVLAAAEPDFMQALTAVAMSVAAPQDTAWNSAPTSLAYRPNGTAQLLPGASIHQHTIHLTSSYIRDPLDGTLRPALILELQGHDQAPALQCSFNGSGPADVLSSAAGSKRQGSQLDRAPGSLAAGYGSSKSLQASTSRPMAAARRESESSPTHGAAGMHVQPSVPRHSRHAYTLESPTSAMPMLKPSAISWSSSPSAGGRQVKGPASSQQAKLLRVQAVLSTLPCIATLAELAWPAQAGDAQGPVGNAWSSMSMGRVLMQNLGSVAYWGKLSTKVDSGAEQLLAALLQSEPAGLPELWEHILHQQHQQQHQPGTVWPVAALWEGTVQVPGSGHHVSHALRRQRRQARSRPGSSATSVSAVQLEAGCTRPQVPHQQQQQHQQQHLPSPATLNGHAYTASDLPPASPSSPSVSISNSVLLPPAHPVHSPSLGATGGGTTAKGSPNPKYPEPSGSSGAGRHTDAPGAPSGHHLQCILSSMVEINTLTSELTEESRRLGYKDSFGRTCPPTADGLSSERAAQGQGTNVTQLPRELPASAAELPGLVRCVPSIKPVPLSSIQEAGSSQATHTAQVATVNGNEPPTECTIAVAAGIACGKAAAEAAQIALVPDGRSWSQPVMATSASGLQQQRKSVQQSGGQPDTPPSGGKAQQGSHRWRSAAAQPQASAPRLKLPARGMSSDLASPRPNSSRPSLLVKQSAEISAVPWSAAEGKLPQVQACGRSRSFLLPRPPAVMLGQPQALATGARNPDTLAGSAQPSPRSGTFSPSCRRALPLDELASQPSVTTRALKLSMLTDPAVWQAASAPAANPAPGAGHVQRGIEPVSAAAPVSATTMGDSLACTSLSLSGSAVPADGAPSCSMDLAHRLPLAPASGDAGDQSGKAAGKACCGSQPMDNVADTWEDQQQRLLEQQQLEQQGGGLLEPWSAVPSAARLWDNGNQAERQSCRTAFEDSEEDEGSVAAAPEPEEPDDCGRGPPSVGAESSSEDDDREMRWHEVQILPMQDPASGRDALLVLQTDITERHVMTHRMATLTETQLTVLENMFPRQVLEYAVGAGANAPNSTLGSLAFQHEEVTILFMDIVGFTSMSKAVPPAEVMLYLNSLYNRLDNLCESTGCYKVDTAGDCYILAGALMLVDDDGFMAFDWDADARQGARNVVDFARAALRIARAVPMPNQQPTSIRVGIHTGSVVSGLLGTKLLKFSLFGDTMNTSSRMESTCKPGCIQMSEATYGLLEDDHKCLFNATGGIEVKGKGLMATYIFEPDEEWVPLSEDLDVIPEAEAEAEEQGVSLPRPDMAAVPRPQWEPQPSLLQQLTWARLSGAPARAAACGSSGTLPEPVTPTAARSVRAGSDFMDTQESTMVPALVPPSPLPRLHSSPLQLLGLMPPVEARRRRASLSSLPTSMPVPGGGMRWRFEHAKSVLHPGQQTHGLRLVGRGRRGPANRQGIADVFRAAAAVIEQQEQQQGLFTSSPTRGGLKASARHLSSLTFRVE